MWQKITEWLGFTGIHDESVWQDILVSSFLIPIVIYLAAKLYHWWNAVKPSRLIFKKYLSEYIFVYIFHSAMSSVDENWNLIKAPKYITRFPQPIPTDASNIAVQKKLNIDPVTSLADSECVADVFNVLGQVNKTRNIIIADLMKDWNIKSDPIFTVGFNPKTANLMRSSYPIYFQIKETKNPVNDNMDAHVCINNSQYKFGCDYPYDSGILQKSFNIESETPVFILAGLGTAGTKAAGHILKEYYIVLGKLYGSRAFCVFFTTKINEGVRSTSIQKIVPNPTYLKRILYPVLFYRFWKRKYFKLD